MKLNFGNMFKKIKLNIQFTKQPFGKNFNCIKFDN